MWFRKLFCYVKLVKKRTWTHLNLWIFVSEKFIILLYERRDFVILVFSAGRLHPQGSKSKPFIKIKSILFSNFPERNLPSSTSRSRLPRSSPTTSWRLSSRSSIISNKLKSFFYPRDWKDSNLASRGEIWICVDLKKPEKRHSRF